MGVQKMKKSIRKELAKDPHWLHRKIHFSSSSHMATCKIKFASNEKVTDK